MSPPPPPPPSRSRHLIPLVLLTALAAGLIYALTTPIAGLPAIGVLFDPVDGLYRTARLAAHPDEATVALPALQAPVEVVRDERGVPHLFAESDRDAITAMGYVVAQDRLFQLDFIPRVAAGRLAEAFGPSALDNDRFLRRTGMDWGARKTAAFLQQAHPERYAMIQWYADGVNAYLDGLDAADLPLEFRLLGYRPDPYTPLQALRLLQYMTFDLTYRTDAADYTALAEALGPDAYRRLYPPYEPLAVPIIPDPGGTAEGMAGGAQALMPPGAAAPRTLAGTRLPAADPSGPLWEGFRPGKGSNNWAVAGVNATTGAPILAGDMHLSLTLPAIWYEVHLATPAMNTYGVTIPGAPLPVEAFNDHLAWAFTNTGSDQIDHLALTLDPTGRRYLYEGDYRALEAVVDTIYVKGGTPVVDTLYYAHWGPVTRTEAGAVALRWVAHEPSRTLAALWGMNHARDLEAFEEAVQLWDTPMQNILYADVDGHIAIRSTGLLPIRAAGTGAGLRDGATAASAWTGRVPFEALPHSRDPAQGFLTSTNQQPADSTYPYYLGHDWRSVYRSMRIDTLLRSRPRHSVDDLMRYQADVHAVQHDLFLPLLDTLPALSPRADTLRQWLARWDGDAGVDRPEPLILDAFLRSLRRLAWDEPVFEGRRTPAETRLYTLLRDHPTARWLDVQATPARETAADLLRAALEEAAVYLDTTYGWGTDRWRWGDHHKVELRHLTGTRALRALWREAEYPGFAATLSPAGSRPTTHSASWRVVVDLSQSPPQGYGIYPGGQSGNPFSVFYDAHLADFVAFRHYTLHKPATPDGLAPGQVSSRLRLEPPQQDE